MLDSLHRRPRGRPLAPVLSRITGGLVPPPPPPPPEEAEEDVSDSRLLEALRRFRAPEYPERIGPATAALLDRIDEDDVAAVMERLEPSLQEVWDAASPVTREYLKLIFGAYYGV